MKRQRNTTQVKEQTSHTEVQICRCHASCCAVINSFISENKLIYKIKKEVQINEEEIGKLPEKESRIMIVKMIENLENKMEKMQKSINKDLEELKNKHAETNTLTEIKNTLGGIYSRISEAEERISELEDKMGEITSEEQNKGQRMKRTEDSLRYLWDSKMHQHSNYMGSRKIREKESV